MKIELRIIGKTNYEFVDKGMEEFFNRVKKYISFQIKLIPALKKTKNLNSQQIKEKEGKLICDQIQKGDFLVLLDENGKEFNSVQFADFIEKRMNASTQKLVFQIGGAYGFSDEVYKKAQFKLSLSKMTFSHQLIRLIFAEQLYRAYSIIHRLPYHNP